MKASNESPVKAQTNAFAIHAVSKSEGVQQASTTSDS